jgi:hypothetical protein
VDLFHGPNTPAVDRDPAGRAEPGSCRLVVDALMALVEPEQRGDPESPAALDDQVDTRPGGGADPAGAPGGPGHGGPRQLPGKDETGDIDIDRQNSSCRSPPHRLERLTRSSAATRGDAPDSAGLGDYILVLDSRVTRTAQIRTLAGTPVALGRATCCGHNSWDQLLKHAVGQPLHSIDDTHDLSLPYVAQMLYVRVCPPRHRRLPGSIAALSTEHIVRSRSGGLV